MSYLVLARKYRSGTFDEVVGQEHVARTLKRAIESDRIAHAFLFTGTRGVGKTSMARILARALNCDQSKAPTPTPCGQCTSCLAIARGDDMDVIEIDAASNTSVENIRELIENSRFRPARARFKVYIIDEVHMLSKGAFNALLKTLEEPPSHVKFILATTETEKVPPTILSRCQRYDFRNIATREIAAHLKALCKAEKVKADDDALMMVARAGAGSMRDALSLLDRVLSLGEKSVSTELIEQMLGLPRAQVVFDLAQAIGEGDTRRVLESSDRIIRDGLSPEQLVASLAEHLRNLLLLATCGRESDLVEVVGLSIDDMATQARRFDLPALTQSIAVLEDLRRGLRSSSVGRAMLDAVLVRLTLAEQFVPIAALLDDQALTPTASGQKKKSEIVTPPPADRATAREARPAPPADPAEPPPEEAPSVTVHTFAAVGDDASDDEDEDALPAVGKVHEGPTRSLGAILAADRARTSGRPRIDASIASDSNLAPVQQGEFAGVMARLREALRPHGPGLEGLLVYGQIVSVQGGQVVLRFGRDHEASAITLERNGKRETVQQVLGELLNEPVGLRIEVDRESSESPASPRTAPDGQTSPPPRMSAAAQVTPRDERQTPAPPAPPPLSPEQKQKILSNDALARAACELFDGDIVKAE